MTLEETEALYQFDRARSKSLWLDEALTAEGFEKFRETYSPLGEDVDCDICIVGGGFAGLWTAIRLKRKRPSLSVVIVERDACGAGASGRNGGLVLSWWSKVTKLIKCFGENEAVWLAGASQEAIDEIETFSQRSGIGHHFRRSGWLWTATSEAQDGAWCETLEILRSLAVEPMRELQPDEAQELAGSRRHRGGVFEASAATLQPAFLGRALRAEAASLGVKIYEGTALRRLKRGARPVVVCTRGSVKSDKVIIAMNAWGIGIPELRRTVAVVSSDVIASSPKSPLMEQYHWKNGMAVSDSRSLVHYYRSTPDERIVFGKGAAGGRLPFAGRVGDGFDGPSESTKELLQSACFLYPEFSEASWPVSWMGPIDKSMSGLPQIGTLPRDENVLFAIGFSGNGVGPTALCSKILCSLALEESDEWSTCGLVGPPQSDFPYEPARYVGGKIIRSAMRQKEAAEDAGDRPGRLVTAIASLAPAALSPLKQANETTKPSSPVGKAPPR